jgi:predicted glutamine amidotransferase
MSFRKLAAYGMIPPKSKPGHSDGWGIVTWINEAPMYLGREPTDALKDKKYALACEKLKQLNTSSPVLVHLRKASVGLKVQENTHPFLIREWAFAHNGTIRKLGLRSTTDSQWFFEALMEEYEKTSSMSLAIRQRVRTVHETFPYTSMTFILSNGKELYAYRDCTKNYDYYGMYYAKLANAIVICQEKFFDADWNALGNGELLHIDSGKDSSVSQVAEPIVPRLWVSKS